jgi:hypothetical protein
MIQRKVDIDSIVDKPPRRHADVVKVKTKLRDAAFEAEGPHNLVQHYYEQFVNAVLQNSLFPKEKEESDQSRTFIQRGFDQLTTRERIDEFMEAERLLRKLRGQRNREWPHLLHEWDTTHPEEKEEIKKDI